MVEKRNENPRNYCIYLSKMERIVLENVDKIFLDVGGNATIFSNGVCIAAFPAKGYMYIVAEEVDMEPETVSEEPNLFTRKVK